MENVITKNREVMSGVSAETLSYRINKIWWLASYPKSGNTWLRILLSAYITQGPVDINNVRITQNDQSPYFFQAVSPRPWDRLTDAEKLMLRPAGLLHLGAMHNNPLSPLLVKTHCPASSFLIPPPLTYGAICIVRDPRDIVVSYAQHMGLDIDDTIKIMADETAAIFMAHKLPFGWPVSSWSANVDSWLSASPMPRCVLKYEEVRTNPTAALKQMLKFLHFEVRDDVARRAVENSDIAKLRKQEEEKGFTEMMGIDRRFFNKGLVGGWRDVLTKKQSERIEHDHGAIMKAMGYL